MIPGIEAFACQDLAVPAEIMHHIVRVESSYNPYAIGVVGTRLARQPRSLAEAVATARQLERDGFNFSLGLAQVNLHNLARQGLDNYELAFDPCPNLAAGSRILADCHRRAGGDWDKAFSCYYSGNFSTGFRDGYVQKVRASISSGGANLETIGVAAATPAIGTGTRPLGTLGRDGERWARRRGTSAEQAVPHREQSASPPAISSGYPATARPDEQGGGQPAQPFVPVVGTPAIGGNGQLAGRPGAQAERDTAFVF